ncbi:DNA-directed RNA polymerase subunit RPB2 [uncultured virus]|nr:DNA-directed RNA polymerase subunit RPB2 [uncultured virus]
MTTPQPTIVTLEDDEKIIEPGFVTPEEFQKYINEGVFPSPLKIEEEPLDETNEGLPGALVLSPSGQLLKQYITWEGFGDHHIEVYDNWIFRSAFNNVYGRMLQFKDDRVVCYENLKVFPPRYTRDGKVLPLTPKLAREEGVTYGSDWHVDVVIRRGSCTGEELDRRTGVCIGTIPVMLKSRNCILHGKSPRELALLGEDPKDPGGYFIVSGVEKVVLLQEQLAVNKIFLMNMDSKGSTVARMTANTVRGTALIELALDKKTQSVMKIRFPSMRGAKQGEKYKSLNVLRIFRIFGVADPIQIQNIIALFMKPEHIKKSMFKLTRNLVDFMMFPDDIEIMANKMDKSRLTFEEKEAEVRRVLDTDLFPHLNNLPGPDNETAAERDVRIATAKIHLLAIMIARFLEYMAGFRPLDDRDSWSNKRVEGAGRMMEQLFRNAWRKTLGIVQAAIENGAVKDLGGVVEKMRYSVITDTFHDSFITSNWGVKGTQMKNNVAQTLVRDSVAATLAHTNTVDVGISRTDRQQALRRVQNSQWGLIDPASTPEGENAGILKNLAVTAKVSLERSDTEIIRLLIGDQAKGIVARVSSDLAVRDQWPDKIIVNGKFLGWCDGEETRSFLVGLRRSGALPFDMSVIKEADWLYIDIGPSRLMRPLLIVDPDQQLAIDRLGLRGNANQQAAFNNLREKIPQNAYGQCAAPNHILLCSGAMEYMSSWEQEYIKVASTVDSIRKRLKMIEDANETYRLAAAQLEEVRRGVQIIIEVDDEKVPMTIEEAQKRVDSANDGVEKMRRNRPYTHCELDPLAILGVAAALIPWPNHNQAPRNTYQISMGKQALGVFHSNHLNRMTDGKTKILAFANRPMVETEMYNIIGLDERGPGENVTIAFMAFPFTEEDSFVIKKEFLDNGGFRIYKYLTYKTIVKHSGEVIEKLTRPDPRPGEPADRYKYIQQGDPDSPVNGLPMIGAPLRQGHCVIGKIQHVPATKDIRNESVILRVGDEGVVDKVLVTSDNKTTVVTVKLRVMRVPQEGDKFAPRNAQKGTCGLVMSDIDMPVSESGIVPDFIVNPHSIPSRMTMEYILELLAAKHGAMRGVHVNGGAFQPFNFREYRNTMIEYGLHEFGYEKMRSGTSGKQLQALIYSGPVFFQALKHHVIDKVQVRSTGQVKPMTRQPPKGRGNRGGLRFGEMERDAAISHGASSFLRAQLMYVSDAYQTAFCQTCGTFAIYDGTTRLYKPCRLCGDDKNFGRCTIPYAYKLLVHLLAAPGINLRPEFVTSDEYADRIFRNDAGAQRGNLDDIKTQLIDADAAYDDEVQEYEDEGQDFNVAEIYD